MEPETLCLLMLIVATLFIAVIVAWYIAIPLIQVLLWKFFYRGMIKISNWWYRLEIW